jgi:hypothetical protein
VTSLFKKFTNAIFEKPRQDFSKSPVVTEPPIETAIPEDLPNGIPEAYQLFNQLLTSDTITIRNKENSIIFGDLPLHVSLTEDEKSILIQLSYDTKDLLEKVKDHDDYKDLTLSKIIFNGYSVFPNESGPNEHPENYFVYKLNNCIHLFNSDKTITAPVYIELDYVETTNNTVSFLLDKEDLRQYTNCYLPDVFTTTVNAQTTKVTLEDNQVTLHTRVMPYIDLPTTVLTQYENINTPVISHVDIPRQIVDFSKASTDQVAPVLEDLVLDLPDGFTLIEDDYNAHQLQLAFTKETSLKGDIIVTYLTATNQTDQRETLIPYLLDITPKEPNGIFKKQVFETDDQQISLMTPLEELIQEDV